MQRIVLTETRTRPTPNAAAVPLAGTLFLAAFALTCATAPTARADTTVGATREIPEGKIDYTPVPDVSPTSGEWAPRIAFEVLPAPGGAAPSVSLVYSAKLANNLAGAGWGLSFESSITRKSKRGGMAEMTDDDSFWIDGQQLMKYSDGTYRAIQYDNALYTPVWVNGHISGWEVLKDGAKRVYGMDGFFDWSNANAVEYRDETCPSGVPIGLEQTRWLLSSTSTAFGATMSYRYIVPDVTPLRKSSLRHLPDKIIYAESGTTSNEVDFGYEIRNDLRVSRATGPERIESKRLRRIVVTRIDGSAATSRYYLLSYRDAVHSPQSLLDHVDRLEVADPLAGPSVASEDGWPSESVAKFAYEDSETTWGEQQAIVLVGDPPQTLDGNQFFRVPMAVDVNGDALVDLVVFQDGCTEGIGGGGGLLDSPGTIDPPDSLPIHDCEPDHRVYLNTIVESVLASPGARLSATPVTLTRHHDLVYDAALSQQVTDFFGSLHTSGLSVSREALIADLNRDGFADLINGGDVLEGGSDGWTGSAVSMGLSELSALQFADVNGDGFPDLVGQSGYYPNAGTPPYFASTAIDIVDPMTEDHASTQYDTPSIGCLDASDYDIYLFWDYGVDENGKHQDPAPSSGIDAAQWVWRNTVHMDVNGDGLVDRVYSVPFLQRESDLDYDGFPMWIRNDSLCGVYSEVFLGDGQGGFSATGYGIGGPMQGGRWVTQTRTEVPVVGGLSTETYSYPLNHFAAADVDADGRNEITQFCDDDATFVALWHQGIANWRGYGPGYQMDANTSLCPDQFTATVPEEFYGLSLLDYHFSTFADFDGDGMEDIFQYSYPIDESIASTDNIEVTPWMDWSEGAHWRKNARSTAQNRLTSIIWPHGGETQAAWKWSAEDPDNHFAINVEHIETLEDQSGTNRFAFTNGVYSAGEFLGFGRVETSKPRGARPWCKRSSPPRCCAANHRRKNCTTKAVA